jgi:hypothetical protein
VCCAGIDLDPTDAKQEKRSKQRGVSDQALAKRLRAELTSLLATPLHQRVNANFFTGGAAQPVAASLSARKRGKGDARGDDALDRDQQEVDGANVVSTGAVQQSIALAQSLVDEKQNSRNQLAQGASKQRSAGKSGKGVKRKATLAECQAEALQQALLRKQQRKAGSKAIRAVAGAGVKGIDSRRLGGTNALQALGSR